MTDRRPGNRRADAGDRRRARRRTARGLQGAQRRAARDARGVRRAACDCCRGLKAEGRKLGIVTAKRHRTGRRSHSERFPVLASALRRRRHARGHGAGTSPIRTPCCSRSSSSAARRRDAVYVGDSPFDIGAAKARGRVRGRGRAGVASTRTSACWRRSPTRSCARRRSSSMSSRTAAPADAGGRASAADRAPQLPLPRPRRPGAVRRRAYDALFDELAGARGGASRARHAPTRRRSASARLASDGFRKVRAPRADGVAREGDDATRRSRSGPTTSASASAPTSRSPTCSSRRSTGSAVIARLRGRRARARRDARRRAARRGRDRRTCARSRRSRCACAADDAAAASLEVRGEIYLPLAGFRALNERLSRGRARSSRRTPRNAAAGSLRQKNSGDHRRAPAVDLGLRHRRPSKAPSCEPQWEALEWLRERGFRTNPYAERLESIEEVAAACVAWETRRASSSTTRSTGS